MTLGQWPFPNAHFAEPVCVYCGKSHSSEKNPLQIMGFGPGNEPIHLGNRSYAMVHKDCQFEALQAFLKANFRPI